MAKNAKMNDEEENKIIDNGGQRKIIFLALEVWVDVLGFIRRIQLARAISLTNRHFYQICWPRLHGAKVAAHEVWPIIIGCRHGLGQSPTALLLKGGKEVPFSECSLPDYITGFQRIYINFLDDKVLAFLTLIAPRITTTKQVRINFTRKISALDENQLTAINGMLQVFREKMTKIPRIIFNGCLSYIQFLPSVDHGMEKIDCCGIEESDIKFLMKVLASPRPDGQQLVMSLHFRIGELHVAQKLLDAIKEDFRTSNQPGPQPFYLEFVRANLNIPQHEEERNPQTDETLTIAPNRKIWCFDICRHPRGQHEQCAEDARKRLIERPTDRSTTYMNIYVNISEFGVCSP